MRSARARQLNRIRLDWIGSDWIGLDQLRPLNSRALGGEIFGAAPTEQCSFGPTLRPVSSGPRAKRTSLLAGRALINGSISGRASRKRASERAQDHKLRLIVGLVKR